MITRMGNDGMLLIFLAICNITEQLWKCLDGEKMSKMKKLLEILSNPHQRMPLDTLIKCEIVLEKIDFKRGDGLPFKVSDSFRNCSVSLF